MKVFYSFYMDKIKENEFILQYSSAALVQITILNACSILIISRLIVSYDQLVYIRLNTNSISLLHVSVFFFKFPACLNYSFHI